MKVVIITTLFPPDTKGGAEVVAAAEAAQLYAAGHTVMVIAAQRWRGWGSWRPTITAQDGITVYRFWVPNLFSFHTIDRWPLWWRLPWHVLDMFNLFSYFTVRRILSQEQPDEVRTHNVKGIGYTVWAAVRATGIRLVHTIHDVQLIVPSGLLMVGQERQLISFPILLYLSLSRALVGSPTEVISPSRWLIDFYRDQGFFQRSKLTVNLAFGQLPPVQQLNLAPDHQPVRLLFVGQIETHKGLEWLIRKLNNYELRITNYELELEKGFHLDIVGDGSRLEMVKEIVAGDARFTVWGRVSPEKLSEFFARADFTVVPSQCYENAPTIIAESLQAGVPVIASAVGGVPEMVVEGVNGVFVA